MSLALQSAPADAPATYLPQTQRLERKLTRSERRVARLERKLHKKNRIVRRLHKRLVTITMPPASPEALPIVPPPTPVEPAGGGTNTSVDWQAIAECESGGNWSEGDGIGPDVTGGLQIATSTWLAYGGGAYASKAMYATESEQIAVAERVLAGQGVGAWPVCGSRG